MHTEGLQLTGTCQDAWRGWASSRQPGSPGAASVAHASVGLAGVGQRAVTPAGSFPSGLIPMLWASHNTEARLLTSSWLFPRVSTCFSVSGDALSYVRLHCKYTWL